MRTAGNSTLYKPELYPQKQKQRTCSPVPLGRPPRTKLWTSVLIGCLVVSIVYTAEVTRTIQFLPPYASSPSSTRHHSTTRNLPPDYSELRKWESKLPQHRPDLLFPEGRSGRSVLFSNSRVNRVGWNNKLNDMYGILSLLQLSRSRALILSSARLLNTWLAHESNRAYVFHDFIWAKTHYPWRTTVDEPDPRTPLNALMSGPSAGGPWDQEDAAPRAVSEAWFDVVCPKQERKIINTRDVKPALQSADGKVIFETWRRLLDESPERCIEVVAAGPEEDAWPETFDIHFWSGHRSVSLWNKFKVAPVSRLLATSPTVESAIDTNAYLFRAPRSPDPSQDTFQNVLSIHVRRGDFKEACIEHAQQNSTFYNWNLLPFLPDAFEPPSAPTRAGLAPGQNTADNEAIFLARCLPSADSITQTVRKAKNDYLRSAYTDSHGGYSPRRPRNPSLDVLYVMSNDRTPWLDNLKQTLKNDGWKHIVTSRDLDLTSEQQDVSVAVDMDIGRRSAVFIGNGVSIATVVFDCLTSDLNIYSTVVLLHKQRYPSSVGGRKKAHQHSSLVIHGCRLFELP